MGAAILMEKNQNQDFLDLHALGSARQTPPLFLPRESSPGEAGETHQ